MFVKNRKSLGPYLKDQPGYLPQFELCCPRLALEEYVLRVSRLQASPYVDPDRPAELLPRVFISVVPRAGLYFPIQSSSISSVIKKILKDVGIDVTRFKPHILRSASLAAAIAGGCDVDAALARASVSKKVFSIFYDLPISAAGPPAASGSAAALAPTASALTASALSGRPAASESAPPSNHDEASGVFSRRSLMDQEAAAE